VVGEGYDHIPMDGYFQDNTEYAWYLFDWLVYFVKLNERDIWYYSFEVLLYQWVEVAIEWYVNLQQFKTPMRSINKVLSLIVKRWLIDWCLTPNLAVSQLYLDTNTFYILEI
jgi:hypothetical protein